MEKEYYLLCFLGSNLYHCVEIDQWFFDSFYYNDKYFCKCFSCVRNGFIRDYYTFYKERSNGLANLNSIVNFMVFYNDIRK